MKRILIASLVLGSVSSFATDISALIVSPSLGDNVLFSANSDQNGICKSSGYERAAAGSADRNCKGMDVLQVVVDGKGQVIRGERGTDYCRISRIICLNNSSSKQITTHLISKPTHYSSEVPYSSGSNENGVCKSLGYETGAIGSAVKNCQAEDVSQIIVDDSGFVIGGDLGIEVCRIDRLVCISKI